MNITHRLLVCIGPLAVWDVLMAPAVAQSVPLFPAQLSGANIEVCLVNRARRR